MQVFRLRRDLGKTGIVNVRNVMVREQAGVNEYNETCPQTVMEKKQYISKGKL